MKFVRLYARVLQLLGSEARLGWLLALVAEGTPQADREGANRIDASAPKFRRLTAAFARRDGRMAIRDGVLIDVCEQGQLAVGLELAPPPTEAVPAPLPRHAADEVLCLARAIERASFHARLLWCSGEWAWPASRVPQVTRLQSSEPASTTAPAWSMRSSLV